MTKPTSTRAFIPALFTIALLAAVPAAWVSAQDAVGDELSDDELFGGESLVTQADDNTGDASAALLKSETVKLGGRFFMDMEGSGNPDAWGDDISTYLAPEVALGFDLYVDARPDEDLRVFIKGRMEYPFTGNGDYELREAFADTVPVPGLFVRSGKQTANWGVGYFFSPANLLNTQRVPWRSRSTCRSVRTITTCIRYSTKRWTAAPWSWLPRRNGWWATLNFRWAAPGCRNLRGRSWLP